jgi:hypothetical protein
MEIMKNRTGKYPAWDSMDAMSAEQAHSIIAEYYKRWENVAVCSEVKR